MTIYDFSVKNGRGDTVSLADYRGKVLLVVNTATGCGLTPQYEGLEALYQQYHDQGFEILDFPSNQFLNQAPGTDDEIDSFCKLNYGTTFPRFAKIDVNGENTAPLYAFLKKEQPDDIMDDTTQTFAKRIEGLTPYDQPGDIRWNFGKFLVGRQGNVVARYFPAVTPETLSKDIEAQLAK